MAPFNIETILIVSTIVQNCHICTHPLIKVKHKWKVSLVSFSRSCLRKQSTELAGTLAQILAAETRTGGTSMIYRMLALNIDGTIVNEQGKIAKEVKEAIEYVKDKGVHVTLVTSRSFPSAKKVAKALKIDAPIVTHQGAFIAADMDEPIYVNKISENVTYEVVQFLERFTARIHIVHENFSVMNKSNANSKALGKMTWQRESRFIYSKQFVDVVSDYLLENPVATPKIEVELETSKDVEDLQLALNGMYGELDVIKTSPRKVDIVPKGVSKLRGLLYLSEKLGLKKEQIAMVGTGLDDKDILEWCGLGAAMGNSSSEVKKSADWITRAGEQHGLVYFIMELFRKQQPIEFLKKMNVIK
jgi:Cof subfamily protein (haloacid dehalogenase superfamily)